jgi:hypothetical protein
MITGPSPGDWGGRQNPAYEVPDRAGLVPACFFLSAIYWAAKTNGTLTVVVPLEAGNCHPRTRAAMQRDKPR